MHTSKHGYGFMTTKTEWKCPHCGGNEGVDVCEMVPFYYHAEVVGGVVEVQADHGEAFYDGSEFDAIRCLSCRAEILNMETNWN